MQVLIQVECLDELDQLTTRLHSAGIPTFHQQHGGRGHKYWVVFVRIDSQLEEAQNLLTDQSYIVKNPVSAEDHARLMDEEANAQFSVGMLGDLTMIAIILAVVVGALIIRTVS